MLSMAYLDQIVPVSSTVEAVHIIRRASVWSWFDKNTIYLPRMYVYSNYVHTRVVIRYELCVMVVSMRTGARDTYIL